VEQRRILCSAGERVENAARTTAGIVSGAETLTGIVFKFYSHNARAIHKHTSCMSPGCDFFVRSRERGGYAGKETTLPSTIRKFSISV